MGKRGVERLRGGKRGLSPIFAIFENFGQTASREKSPLEQAAQGIATDTVKNRVTTAASAALL